MTQLTLDNQLAFAHPALVGRTALRDFAEQQMRADIRRANRYARGRGILVHRKVAHSRQWYACLACEHVGRQWQSRPWSSATNPPPKWAQRLRDAHRAEHCDAWLVERGYVVPGEDREIDLVLGDVIVRAFGALQVVS